MKEEKNKDSWEYVHLQRLMKPRWHLTLFSTKADLLLCPKAGQTGECFGARKGKVELHM